MSDLNLDSIEERLIQANGLAMDESVARWYRRDVTWLVSEVHRLKGRIETLHNLSDQAFMQGIRTRQILETVAAGDAISVAPDAEPTGWAWSLNDVVQSEGTVWARITDGTYPWRSVTGHDQRDQDITDLVTKHSGRVLVCKARGIGTGSPC